MVNVVVLDGYTLNPGDLSWETLEKLGNCRIYDRTAPADIISRAADAEIVLVNKVIMNRRELEQLPRLKYIGVLATGYNVVDVTAAKERGITVTNIPAYSTASVAQQVFAHLLNLTMHVAPHAQAVRSGRWGNSVDFCFWDFPLIELQDLTLGIIGCGRIGQETAKIARAFGMKVIGCGRNAASSAAVRAPDSAIEMVPLDTLFKNADVITLHCPLTAGNRQMINAGKLSLMKKNALLINTSRGALIDETALADALNNGIIAGAGLDVLSSEPPAPDNPLLTAKNCSITPHIAWATLASRQRLLNTAVENIQNFLNGTVKNQV
jgi:glycerate dehydrogenase